MRVPVDVVYGAQDQFIAMGTMRVIERLRNVTVHRVELNDHIVRPRLARVVAAAIGPAVGQRDPARPTRPRAFRLGAWTLEPWAAPAAPYP